MLQSMLRIYRQFQVLLRDKKGSAYAWLTFFVFMWVFCMIWFYFIDPLFTAGMETAKNSGFTSLQGADAFYGFFEALYPVLPLLMFFFAVIGFLKYASSTKKRWEE